MTEIRDQKIQCWGGAFSSTSDDDDDDDDDYAWSVRLRRRKNVSGHWSRGSSEEEAQKEMDNPQPLHKAEKIGGKKKRAHTHAHTHTHT